MRQSGNDPKIQGHGWKLSLKISSAKCDFLKFRWQSKEHKVVKKYIYR